MWERWKRWRRKEFRAQAEARGRVFWQAERRLFVSVCAWRRGLAGNAARASRRVVKYGWASAWECSATCVRPRVRLLPSALRVVACLMRRNCKQQNGRTPRKPRCQLLPATPPDCGCCSCGLSLRCAFGFALMEACNL